MDSALPFKPSGQTFALGITAAAAPSATLLGSGLAGDIGCRFYNSGGGDAFIGYGPTSTVASNNAVVPLISGGPQPVLSVKNGETRVFTLNGYPFLFVAGVSVAGSATVYATPGFGIA